MAIDGRARFGRRALQTVERDNCVIVDFTYEERVFEKFVDSVQTLHLCGVVSCKLYFVIFLVKLDKIVCGGRQTKL